MIQRVAQLALKNFRCQLPRLTDLTEPDCGAAVLLPANHCWDVNYSLLQRFPRTGEDRSTDSK